MMAQYKISAPDDLIECPYDEVHMIMAKRMPYHLMKCRRNYVGNNYVRCPFNARHEVPKPEMRYHISICTDKATVEKDLIEGNGLLTEGRYFKGCTAAPPIDDSWMPESEEDWDREASRCSVNVIDKSVFLIPKRHTPQYERMNPQERRAIYERLQHSGIDVEAKADHDVLRLPHNPPMVLGTIKTAEQDEQAKRKVQAKLDLGASLLQSMARGRGVLRPSLVEEPRVGIAHHV